MTAPMLARESGIAVLEFPTKVLYVWREWDSVADLGVTMAVTPDLRKWEMYDGCTCFVEAGDARPDDVL